MKDFIIVVLITSIWVNLSEVLRYFLVVRPKTITYLSMVPDISSINYKIAVIWGFLDMLLTCLYVFLFWLCAQTLGNNTKSVIISAVVAWCFFFVLFWVGMANMNLPGWAFLIVVLPLTLIETLVASFVASKIYSTLDSAPA
ncbi:MAG: hypothetical protein COC05_06325 [Gammaproteobacteria bacterium]|nr:MAG: hypothetical protein COC05_06325 [Gammaproteobacteria bacterium]